MPVYEYKGLDAKGKNTTGLVDADSPKTARQKLRKQGVFTTEIREGKAGQTVRRGSGSGGGSGSGSGSKKSGRGSGGSGSGGKKAAGGGGLMSVEVDFSKYLQPISVQDIAIATRQLAALLGAGIPLVESLGALGDQVEKENFRIILREVREQVNEGTSLAKALEGYPKVFSNLYVNMVRAGEQAGAIEHVLGRLADYTEAQVELRGKVLAAMTYPIIMMLVALGVISFLMIFVVPKITKVFNDMGADLPWITKVVIFISEALQNYWWLFLGGGILSFIAFGRYYRSEHGRARVDSALLRMPLFGRMLMMVSISRFASTLSTLMMSGVPLLSAMNIVKNIVGNVVLKDVVANATEAVREGQPMNLPLKKSGRFPPMVTHMIAVGERTGGLSEMLDRVAITYEGQVNRRLATLTALLEPLMILVMGGLVFFIALAVLLPMLQMNTLAGR